MYSHEITVLNSSEHRQSIAAEVKERKSASCFTSDRGSFAPKTLGYFSNYQKEGSRI